jgi:hypothetical protein
MKLFLLKTFFCLFTFKATRVTRGKTNMAYVEDDEDENETDGGRGGRDESNQSSVLPWKRENTDSESNKPMKQSEFPSWINNKEYTQNYSPYSTVNQGNYFPVSILKYLRYSLLSLF